MDKKMGMIIGLIIVVLVTLGIIVALNRDKDENTNETTNSQTSSSGSEQLSVIEQNGTPDFSLLNTADQEFIATLEGTLDGQASVATIEYDTGGRVKFTIMAEGDTIESYLTDELLITCTDGECFGAPNTQGSVPIDPADFNYDQSDVDLVKDQATYLGVQACPVGQCNAWQFLDEDQLQTTVYIDANGRLIQVNGTDETTDITLTYDYRDVDFEVPTEYSDFSDFGDLFNTFAQ